LEPDVQAFMKRIMNVGLYGEIVRQNNI